MMEKEKDHCEIKHRLRCAEAMEVMGQIPPAIIRWGITAITAIIAAVLTAACLIRWPVIVECPCNIQMLTENTCYVAVQLSPKVVEHLARGKITTFSVQSPLLNDAIIQADVGLADLNYGEDYTLSVQAVWPAQLSFPDAVISQFSGKAIFLLPDRKLIFHLFPYLEGHI